MKLLKFAGATVLLSVTCAGAGCSDSDKSSGRSDAAAGTSGTSGSGGAGATSGGSAGSGGAGGRGGSGTGGSGATSGSGGGGSGGRGGSGGAGATGGGGGRGGSGTDAGACMYGVDSPNPACDPCAQQNCCDELGACLSNTVCQAVNACVNANATAPCLASATSEAQLRTCIQGLCSDASSGVDAYINVQRCLALSCQTQCS